MSLRCPCCKREFTNSRFMPYCSQACSDIAARASQRVNPWAPEAARVPEGHFAYREVPGVTARPQKSSSWQEALCKHCGVTFRRKNAKVLYCSVSCKSAVCDVRSKQLSKEKARAETEAELAAFEADYEEWPPMRQAHTLAFLFYREMGELLLAEGVSREDVVAWQFSSGGDRSLGAIGMSLGVTRERVRQIEASALGKLRKIVKEDEWK